MDAFLLGLCVTLGVLCIGLGWQLVRSTRAEVALRDELTQARKATREIERVVADLTARVTETRESADHALREAQRRGERLAEVLSENLALRHSSNKTTVCRPVADPLLTTDQVARQLGLASPRSVSALVGRGKLAVARRSEDGRALYRQTDVDVLAASRRRSA